MPRDVEPLRDDERHREDVAPELEIHPLFGGLVGGEPGVDGRHEQEVAYPGHGEARPHGLGQAQLAAQQQLQEVLLPAPQCGGQHHGHAEVQHGGFPFDEALVLQHQGEHAEHQHQHQRDLVDVLQLAVQRVDDAGLHHGGGHEHAGGQVDALQLVGGEKEQDGEEVEQQAHDGAIIRGLCVREPGRGGPALKSGACLGADSAFPCSHRLETS